MYSQNPGPQQAQSASGKSNSSHSYSSKQVVKYVYFLLLGMLLAVCLWSAKPYQELVHHSVVSADLPFFIQKPLNGIPVFGALFGIIQFSIWWFIGLVFWAFIQMCELAPAYIRKDKAMLKLLIQESQGADAYEILEGEDPILSYLKKLYNYVPAHFLKRAGQIAIIAYVADLLIVVQKYPICTGGTAKFNFLLRTGQWEKFDFGHITLLLLNLFLVEAIVRFMFHFFEFRHYVRRAHGG